MEEVFEDTHVGYVDGEDPDDLFAELSDDESVNSEGTNTSDHNEGPCDTKDGDPFLQTDSENDATDSEGEIQYLATSSSDDSMDI